MDKIEKIDESNKKQIVHYLSQDVVKHVFAFYDLQYDPGHTTMHAAFENNKIKGYILTYHATDPQSVVLECNKETAQTLFEHTPSSHFIIHAPKNLLSTIEKKFPQAKNYIENWMLVRKNQVNFFKSNLLKRLCTKDDATLLSDLLKGREDRPATTLNKYIEWISKMPLYGIMKNDKLVSYAGSFIQLPQVWMIGGVYTRTEHRNKGYATLATSAITEEALNNAKAAALFVRSDNCEAIRVYEKIGYRKIGEKIWSDVGTGMKP